MRSEELANAAMQMDKVELCGRHVNIGRPRGYIEPPTGVMAQAKLGMAEQFAMSLNGMPSKTVLLENMLSLDDLKQPDARSEVQKEGRLGKSLRNFVVVVDGGGEGGVREMVDRFGNCVSHAACLGGVGGRFASLREIIDV